MGINLEKVKMKNKEDINFDEDVWINIEYNDILYIISKTVREYREEHNMTQENLAKKIDVSQPMIRKIESSKYNPSVKFLVKMWNKLSTKDENFGAKLLKRISDKIDKNYSYNINIRYDYKEVKDDYNEMIDIKKSILEEKMKYNFMYDYGQEDIIDLAS